MLEISEQRLSTRYLRLALNMSPSISMPPHIHWPEPRQFGMAELSHGPVSVEHCKHHVCDGIEAEAVSLGNLVGQPDTFRRKLLHDDLSASWGNLQ